MNCLEKSSGWMLRKLSATVRWRSPVNFIANPLRAKCERGHASKPPIATRPMRWRILGLAPDRRAREVGCHDVPTPHLQAPGADEFAHRALDGRSTYALIELGVEALREGWDSRALRPLGEDVGEHNRFDNEVRGTSCELRSNSPFPPTRHWP